MKNINPLTKDDAVMDQAGSTQLAKSLGDLKTELNDEMNNQSEMLTDLTNHIQVNNYFITLFLIILYVNI